MQQQKKQKSYSQQKEKLTGGFVYTLPEGGCCGPSYGMDIDEKPGDNDDVVEKNGIKVFVDKDTSKNLKA